jgi:hypothetical protein
MIEIPADVAGRCKYSVLTLIQLANRNLNEQATSYMAVSLRSLCVVVNYMRNQYA